MRKAGILELPSRGATGADDVTPAYGHVLDDDNREAEDEAPQELPRMVAGAR